MYKLNCEISRQIRMIKVHRLVRSGKEVPFIRIEGEWINNLGFKVGEILSVNTRKELLIIEPIGYEKKQIMNKIDEFKNKINIIKEHAKNISKKIHTSTKQGYVDYLNGLERNLGENLVDDICDS